MVVVQLGPLAARALSAAGKPDTARLERILGQSVRFYLGPDRGGAGWPYPKFLEVEDDSGPMLDVGLESEAWDDLSAEAARQKVATDSLLQHAALFFAAARDAGRLTSRILEELERHEGSPLRSRGHDRDGA